MEPNSTARASTTWICTICTFANKARRRRCEMCAKGHRPIMDAASVDEEPNLNKSTGRKKRKSQSDSENGQPPVASETTGATITPGQRKSKERKGKSNVVESWLRNRKRRRAGHTETTKAIEPKTELRQVAISIRLDSWQSPSRQENNHQHQFSRALIASIPCAYYMNNWQSGKLMNTNSCENNFCDFIINNSRGKSNPKLNAEDFRPTSMLASPCTRPPELEEEQTVRREEIIEAGNLTNSYKDDPPISGPLHGGISTAETNNTDGNEHPEEYSTTPTGKAAIPVHCVDSPNNHLFPFSSTASKQNSPSQTVTPSVRQRNGEEINGPMAQFVSPPTIPERCCTQKNGAACPPPSTLSECDPASAPLPIRSTRPLDENQMMQAFHGQHDASKKFPSIRPVTEAKIDLPQEAKISTTLRPDSTFLQSGVMCSKSDNKEITSEGAQDGFSKPSVRLTGNPDSASARIANVDKTAGCGAIENTIDGRGSLHVGKLSVNLELGVNATDTTAADRSTDGTTQTTQEKSPQGPDMDKMTASHYVPLHPKQCDVLPLKSSLLDTTRARPSTYPPDEGMNSEAESRTLVHSEKIDKTDKDSNATGSDRKAPNASVNHKSCLSNRVSGSSSIQSSEPLLGTVGRQPGNEDDPIRSIRSTDAQRESEQTVFSANFCTAGKKEMISVSEESMERANKTLARRNDVSSEALSVLMQSRPSGSLPLVFATAGKGSTVSVSEACLDRARSTLASPTRDAGSCFLPTPTSRNESKCPSLSKDMFSTAGKGNRISVTQASMDRANKILNFRKDDPTVKGKTIPSKVTAVSSTFQATFSTAGKRNEVQVSKESIRKANQIFSTQKRPQIAPPSLNNSLSVAFSTAGKRNKIHVSNDSIEETNRLFSTKRTAAKLNSNPHKAMFSTAGKGSEIVVSEASMVKANIVMGKIEDPKKQLGTAPSTRKPRGGSSSMPPATFETAGKRCTIAVTEGSIAKAHMLMTSFGKDEQEQRFHSEPTENMLHRGGSLPAIFSTAGKGQSIFVSEASLQKARHMVEHDDSHEEKIAQGSRHKSGPGVKCSIERRDAKYCGSRLKNTEKFASSDSSIQHPKLPSTFATVAFSTAGKGAKISVSESSVMEAEKLLETDKQQAKVPVCSTTTTLSDIGMDYTNAPTLERGPINLVTTINREIIGGSSRNMSHDENLQINERFDRGTSMPKSSFDRKDASPVDRRIPPTKLEDPVAINGEVGTSHGTASPPASGMNKIAILPSPPNDAEQAEAQPRKGSAPISNLSNVSCANEKSTRTIIAAPGAKSAVSDTLYSASQNSGPDRDCRTMCQPEEKSKETIPTNCADCSNLLNSDEHTFTPEMQMFQYTPPSQPSQPPSQEISSRPPTPPPLVESLNICMHSPRCQRSHLTSKQECPTPLPRQLPRDMVKQASKNTAECGDDVPVEACVDHNACRKQLHSRYLNMTMTANDEQASPDSQTNLKVERTSKHGEVEDPDPSRPNSTECTADGSLMNGLNLALFQTAGKGDLISVSESSLLDASKLLRIEGTDGLDTTTSQKSWTDSTAKRREPAIATTGAPFPAAKWSTHEKSVSHCPVDNVNLDWAHCNQTPSSAPTPFTPRFHRSVKSSSAISQRNPGLQNRAYPESSVSMNTVGDDSVSLPLIAPATSLVSVGSATGGQTHTSHKDNSNRVLTSQMRVSHSEFSATPSEQKRLPLVPASVSSGPITETPRIPVSTPHNHQLVRWGSIRRITYGLESPAEPLGETNRQAQAIECQSEPARFHPDSNSSTPVTTAINTKSAEVTMSVDGSNVRQNTDSKSGSGISIAPVPISFHGDTDDIASYSHMPERSPKSQPSRHFDEPVSMQDFQNSWESACMTDNLDDCSRDGVQQITQIVDSTNAADVSFDSTSGLPIPFVGVNDSNETDMVGGIEDLREALEAEGCESHLLKDSWIANHKRWIVWKLASYERRFSKHLGGKCLCYKALLDQLQRRFAIEVKEGRRPTLRRILNRDAASTRIMILCVSQVFTTKPQVSTGDDSPCTSYSLELTDGWYSVGASIDLKLSEFVSCGVIRVGTKLMVCGARLTGADDGIDPLDPGYTISSNSSVQLHLSANSTRLAKWNSKLGYIRMSPLQMRIHNTVFCVRRISDVIPGGGNIPFIRIRISKLYPKMFMEKCDDTNSNSTLTTAKYPFLTEAEEEMRRVEFEKRKLKAIETVIDSITAEVEKDLDEMAPAVWHRLMKSHSPGEFYDDLCNEDKLEVSNWKAKREGLLPDRIQKEIDASLECDTSLIRKSTPLIRAHVSSFDVLAPDVAAGRDAHLTIWDPSDEQVSVLKEGTILEVYNLSVRDTTFDGNLQLTANGRTRIEAFSKDLSAHLAKRCQHARIKSLFRVHALSHKMTSGSDLVQTIEGDQVDTVVTILGIEEREERDGLLFFIYVTDETNLILRIHCNKLPTGFGLFEQENPSNQDIVYFLRLRIMPFDYAENCAVATWDDESSFALTSSIAGVQRRLGELRQWSSSPKGKGQINRSQRYVNARIPTWEQYGWRTAIGYVVGLLKSGQFLNLAVDCAHCTSIQEWELPPTVLDSMLEILAKLGDDNTNRCVGLPLEDDERVQELKILGSILRSRGVLWRFSLKRLENPVAGTTDIQFIVHDVSLADTQALGYAYEAANPFAFRHH